MVLLAIPIPRRFRFPSLIAFHAVVIVVVLQTVVWYHKKGWVLLRLLSVPRLDYLENLYVANPSPYYPRFSTTVPSEQLSTTPYTAAVVYLASVPRAQELALSLSYLFSNVPAVQPWPIILFHTGDFAQVAVQKEFLHQLYEYLGPSPLSWNFLDRLDFVQLELKLPDGVPENVHDVKPMYEWVWPGYHHMCRFYASTIFEHPRLMNTTFYMRLDTDSYVVRPLCYDPFERMFRHNLTYAYRSVDLDNADLVQGLWSFVDQYAKSHRDVEDRMMLKNGWTWPGSREDGKKAWMELEANIQFPLYYNNFEVVKLEQFRRGDVKNWLDEVLTDPLRFYKYRWGDAPLRYATVNMFFDVEHEVEQYCDIDYYHQQPIYSECACRPLLRMQHGSP